VQHPLETERPAHHVATGVVLVQNLGEKLERLLPVQ
jgi:hypothetical protein